MAKPAQLPTWATDATLSAGSESGSSPVADPAGAETQGFVPGRGFVARWGNWVVNRLCQWAAYLDNLPNETDFTGEDFAWGGNHTIAGTLDVTGAVTGASFTMDPGVSKTKMLGNIQAIPILGDGVPSAGNLSSIAFDQDDLLTQGEWVYYRDGDFWEVLIPQSAGAIAAGDRPRLIWDLDLPDGATITSATARLDNYRGGTDDELTYGALLQLVSITEGANPEDPNVVTVTGYNTGAILVPDSPNTDYAYDLTASSGAGTSPWGTQTVAPATKRYRLELTTPVADAGDVTYFRVFGISVTYTITTVNGHAQ